MRILHTSDWHLGRSFGDFSLLEEQAAFIDWLVAVVASEKIDLVAIAGDLHDRSIPPAEAVSLLSDAIRRMRGVGAEVVAIAGNHDSGERIGAFDGLVDAGGVVIRGGYASASAVAVREFEDGPLAIVATPFLEPLLAPPAIRHELDALRSSDEGRSPRLSHEAVLGHALGNARTVMPDGMRSLVLSHAFVTGAAPSPSERELAVGDSGMVSAELFTGFDYVALGHLHRPQRVAEHEHIRYSGSPLPYSFGETHQKCAVIVDLDRDGSVTATELPIAVGRRVQTVKGRFDDVVNGPAVTDAWIRVELTDSIVIPDAHRSLRTRFPWLVEIARVAATGRHGGAMSANDLKSRSANELAREFWAEVSQRDATDDVASVLDAAVLEAGRQDVA